MQEQERPALDEIDNLADAIAVSAATVDSATHALLANIRRFDELKGWARQGAKSCAHWLSWRVGDGIGAAREKVRVARALGSLPKIDEALSQGRLSFAKVRAITRVARPEIETLLLQYAEHSTGAQLETICRGFRQVVRICESGRKALPEDERYVHRKNAPSGMVRIEAQLTADEADLVFRALDKARSGKDRADGLVAMAETTLASEPKARKGGERNQIFVHFSPEMVENVSAETPAWRAVLADGSWLSGDALLRLACDAGIVAAKVAADGTVLDVGRKRRTVSSALSRALQIRDGTCRFPGCTDRAFVDAHHIVHWAHGGETKLDNLVLLCHAHHRAVHEEGFAILRGSDGGLLFIDPGGDIIDAVPEPLAPCLSRATFDRKVNLTKWNGGYPLDRAAAVQGLVDRAGLRHHGIPARRDQVPQKVT